MLSFLIAAVVISGVAAIYDSKTGLIPNWLTLGALALGVVLHVAHGWYLLDLPAGLHAGLASVAGAFLCGLAPALMFWKGSMGGGDVKLFAAIGALCHPMLGIETEMYGLLVAAVVAPVRLAAEGRLLRTLGFSLSLVANPLLPESRRRSLPEGAMTWFRLGPSIFAGALVTLAIHGYALLAP